MGIWMGNNAQQMMYANPYGQAINPQLAGLLEAQNQLVRRADPRVAGGVTGVPAMQQMYSATIDTQYGVKLPDALVQKFLTDHPILDRVLSFGSSTQPDRAAVYGLFTGMDFSAGEYGDFVIGGDPPGIRGTRTTASKVKKSYGAMAAITDVDAIASGAQGQPKRYGGMTVGSDRELLLAFCTTKTLTALEYSIVKGNEGSRPTQFDGIETALTYNSTDRPFVVNMAGATTGVFAVLNSLILSQMSYGIQPSELWMHPVLKEALINDYLAQTGRVINISQGNQNMSLGQQADSIITPAGNLPIVTSTHFTLGGTSPNLSGDIFIICRSHSGIPLINFEWMVEPRAIEPLARVPGFYTSQVMGVWAHGVLYDRAGWWAQGRIRNVGLSFNTTTYPLHPFTP